MPEEAQGPYDEDMLIKSPRNMFPVEGVRVGQSFMFEIGKDQEAEGRIVEVTDAKVVIDFDHPLAGKRLTFRVRVISVS